MILYIFSFRISTLNKPFIDSFLHVKLDVELWYYDICDYFEFVDKIIYIYIHTFLYNKLINRVYSDVPLYIKTVVLYTACKYKSKLNHIKQRRRQAIINTNKASKTK